MSGFGMFQNSKTITKFLPLKKFQKLKLKVNLKETSNMGKKDKQVMLRECLEGSMKLTKIIKEQLKVLKENGINDLIISENN